MADDPLAAYYDARPGDRGFHLLIGPPRAARAPARGRELVSEVVARLLAKPGTTRVVCEPDARNARMLACCRALGGERARRRSSSPAGARVLVGWSREAWTAAA